MYRKKNPGRSRPKCKKQNFNIFRRELENSPILIGELFYTLDGNLMEKNPIILKVL